MRTGSPLQKIDRLCQLSALHGPLALGTIHVQRQTDDDELCLIFAVSQTLAATLGGLLSVIWGVMAVVRNSVRSQVARPVRLSP